jgi:GH35 family endo-1,4-beta-xylanase
MARRLKLNVNGHPLVWDFKKWSMPDWLSDEECLSPAVWERRIAQIAERYGQAIPRWDVVNEVVPGLRRALTGESRRLPDDYARHAFRWAEKYLPASAFLMINEVTNAFYGDREGYLQLVKRLIDDGARVNGVGLQFHIFSDDGMRGVSKGGKFLPADLLSMLDATATFGRPVHISEITLPSPKDGTDGEALQAELAANFYRLWFSHPAVHAITWWNFADGTAAPGEDSVRSGLLNERLEPKPAYVALHDLIRRQWRTAFDATTDATGAISFRGFHGQYQIRTTHDTASFGVHAGGSNDLSVTLG